MLETSREFMYNFTTPGKVTAARSSEVSRGFVYTLPEELEISDGVRNEQGPEFHLPLVRLVPVPEPRLLEEVAA